MSELNCAAYRDDLLWYAADTIDGAKRAAIEQHLAQCADCRAEVAQWRGVATSLHHDGGDVPPATFQATWDSIQSHLPPQPQLNGSSPMTGVTHMEFENDTQRVTPIKVRQPEQSPTPRRTKWFAAVAAVLVVVMGIAVFGVLHARTSSSNAGTKTPNIGTNTPSTRSTAVPSGAQFPIDQQMFISDTFALNGNDAWAIGNGPGGAALLLHYANGNWHYVSNNAFPRTVLKSIVMISANEGWAVGVTTTSAQVSIGNTTPTSNDAPFILHYSNGQWTKTTLPSLQGELDDLQMVSANDGLATGKTPSQQPLLLHFHNGVWSQNIVAAPSSDVESVAYSMALSGDLWATDTTHIWHYQQGQWQVSWPATKRTDIHLSNVYALNTRDAWVFVKDASTSPQGHFLHFDGTQWTSVAIQGTTLIEAGFLGHSRWLVSFLGVGNGNRDALHLENGQWKVRMVADTLLRVNDVSATESWAVSTANQVLKIIHYQNGTWS